MGSIPSQAGSTTRLSDDCQFEHANKTEGCEGGAQQTLPSDYSATLSRIISTEVSGIGLAQCIRGRAAQLTSPKEALLLCLPVPHCIIGYHLLLEPT
jgi:hypothetical protein